MRIRSFCSAKSSGMEWTTVRALIMLRLGPGKTMPPPDIEEARVNYERLSLATAERSSRLLAGGAKWPSPLKRPFLCILNVWVNGAASLTFRLLAISFPLCHNGDAWALEMQDLFIIALLEINPQHIKLAYRGPVHGCPPPCVPHRSSLLASVSSPLVAGLKVGVFREKIGVVTICRWAESDVEHVVGACHALDNYRRTGRRGSHPPE